MHTFKYKNGYIHVNFMGTVEVIQWQVGNEWAVCKSVHSAKIIITKKVA